MVKAAQRDSWIQMELALHDQSAALVPPNWRSSIAIDFMFDFFNEKALLYEIFPNHYFPSSDIWS